MTKSVLHVVRRRKVKTKFDVILMIVRDHVIVINKHFGSTIYSCSKSGTYDQRERHSEPIMKAFNFYKRLDPRAANLNLVPVWNLKIFVFLFYL